jgi:RNA polymerase sigma factor (sigma-70 family)
MNTSDSDQSRWFLENLQVHAPALRSYLQGRFPMIDDIENLVQESLRRVLKARDSGEIKSPKGLLFAIARNLAFDANRRHQVIDFKPITEYSDSSVYLIDDIDIAEAICKSEEFDLLTEAIQLLPRRCRQVLTLRAVYGLPQKEIAQRLGISLNTVEKQMAKGVGRCRVYLSGFDLP